MKKLAALLLAAMLLAACAPVLADGDLWYCPVCDTWNTSNYCPNDGTARASGYNYVNGVYVPNTAPQQSTSSSGNYTQYASVTGTLNQRLSTRTGPSTKYDEPGSFLRAGDRVTVLSKAWDDDNNAMGIRPATLAVTLLPVGTVYVLREENDWTLTADNLPTMINGEPVHYSWKEQETIGYVLASMVTDGSSTVFTNRITRVPRLPEGYIQPSTPGASFAIFEEYGTALGVEMIINHVGDCFD